METLIPILMFAATVAISIAEQKKKKKSNGKPRVEYEPVVFEDDAESAETGPDGGADSIAAGLPEEAPATVHAATVHTAATHGKAAKVTDEAEKTAAAISAEHSEKEKIDKKKLIIYSEILKPKFDR